MRVRPILAAPAAKLPSNCNPGSAGAIAPITDLAMNKRKFDRMSLQAWRARQEGRWGYALAWLLGVPLPILIVIYLLRGCQ
jgi:hypothetical protein